MIAASPINAKPKHGFTLIELLVVIAIIAILMALLLPAIQKVREAANKIRCANSLHQIGLALHMFNNDRGRLPQGTNITPPYGSWLFTILPYMEQSGLYEQLKALGNLSGETYGVVDRPPLPYVAPPMYLRCPSDRWDFSRKPASNYAGSMGPQCRAGACGYDIFLQYCDPKNNGHGDWGYDESVWDSPAAEAGTHRMKDALRGVFNRSGTKITFKQIPDGLSQTIFAGESLPGCHDHLGAYWDSDANFYGKVLRLRYGWFTSNGGTAHINTAARINYDSCLQQFCADWIVDDETNPAPDRRQRSWQNWNTAWGFKSRHPGGANILFGDGSIHFLSEDISMEAYNKMGCRDDGEVIPKVDLD